MKAVLPSNNRRFGPYRYLFKPGIQCRIAMAFHSPPFIFFSTRGKPFPWGCVLINEPGETTRNETSNRPILPTLSGARRRFDLGFRSVHAYRLFSDRDLPGNRRQRRLGKRGRRLGRFAAGSRHPFNRSRQRYREPSTAETNKLHHLFPHTIPNGCGGLSFHSSTRQSTTRTTVESAGRLIVVRS